MWPTRRLVAVCAIAICCNTALLALFVRYNIGEKHYITIEAIQQEYLRLPEDFLSFGIDASQIDEYDKTDFSNPNLIALTSALAPAKLRLGGTMSERLIFMKEEISDISCKHCPANITKSTCSSVKKLCKKFLPFFLMTGNQWTKINQFCIASNVRLLFSLNALLRSDDSWNDQNAIQIMKFSKEKGFNIDWQLGNEPNSYPHVFNISISPKMLAKDFKHLKSLLKQYFASSLLVGPDTTRPQPQRPECLKYMVEFLDNASDIINVRSWHQYYLNSRTAKLEDFWKPDTFDLLETQIKTMKNHTQKFSHIPMWLTETSSSYGGGAPGLSNTYAGSPLWIDKLGLAARYNITTVIRQSLIGGNYSMIDKNMKPLPDWWLSLLYKKLVGTKVLSVNSNSYKYHRIYAHCTSKNYLSNESAITIYGINLEFSKVRFVLNGTAFPSDLFNIDEFIISAPSNNRRTKIILLNSWPLYYPSSIPELIPRHLKNTNHISMPPYSIGFWVIRNTNIKVCN